MATRYLTDIIGDGYKNWKPGDCILITNGTGSGKTCFVLNTLLREAKAQRKHLVYFCNRRFLSMQVQSAARELLLNELGEDADDLASYLHIRTYQFAEHVFDYPAIHALDENGKVVRESYEVNADEVLYYVFDESFYIVSDAGTNPNTHYWYDKAAITENKHSISVFLAATPEPLLLYLEFMCHKAPGLTDLCMDDIAMHYINDRYISNEQRMRWMYFYCPRVLGWEEYRDSVDRNAVVLENGIPVNAFEYADHQIRSLIDQTTKEAENPYWSFFKKIEQAYHLENPILTHIYQDERSLTERYDYLDTFYFDDLTALAKCIASSVRKNRRKETKEEDKRHWIVFVRKFEDASALRTALRLLDCKSVAISSKITKNYDGSPSRRKGSVKKTLETLVHEEKLDCDVLISTSVLDCGVSLKNATDMAVCQPDKTSFLQMIGRIRVKEGQRVNLYIHSFTPKEVKGHRDEAAQMFLYMTQLLVMEEKIHKSIFGYKTSAEFNMKRFFGSEQVHFLPKGIYKGLKEKMENDPNRKHFLYRGGYENKAMHIRQDDQPQLNPMAVLHYLNQVYFTRKELPEYTGDPYYFLKVQLSWLGKTYDPECWIDYQNSREQLYDFLADNIAKFDPRNPMDKEEQLAFRQSCFECLSSLRNPPESFQKAKKRHTVGSDNYPGKSKLNEIFTDMGIPYRIESKQNKAQKRDRETEKVLIDPESGKPQIDDKSYWYLIPVDIALEKQKLDAKRETRRIRQEERKAQKVREEAQMPKPEKVRDPKNPYGVVIRNYPKKKKLDREEAIEQKPPKQEKKSIKVQIMYGNEPWDPSKQKER